jgi:hypothetical protein
VKTLTAAVLVHHQRAEAEAGAHHRPLKEKHSEIRTQNKLICMVEVEALACFHRRRFNPLLKQQMSTWQMQMQHSGKRRGHYALWFGSNLEKTP